tara:strand:+ start:18677 stop:19423 length:747 start_codon:yes stop_codon:yes gene_type:complete
MDHKKYLQEIGEQSFVALECLYKLIEDNFTDIKEHAITPVDFRDVRKKCCHYELARSYLRHLEEKQQEIYNTSHEMYGQYVVTQTYLDYSIEDGGTRAALYLDKGKRIFQRYLRDEKRRLKSIAKIFRGYPSVLFVKPDLFKKQFIPIIDEVLTTSPIKPELDMKTMVLQDVIKFYVMTEMENDEEAFTTQMRYSLDEGTLKSFDARYPPDPSKKQRRDAIANVVKAHKDEDTEQLIKCSKKLADLLK